MCSLVIDWIFCSSRVAWVSAAHMSTKLTCGAAGQNVVWFAGRLASGHAFEFRELMWTPSPHSRASMSHQSKASAPPQPPHHYPPTSPHPIATDKHPHKPIRHGLPHPRTPSPRHPDQTHHPHTTHSPKLPPPGFRNAKVHPKQPTSRETYWSPKSRCIPNVLFLMHKPQ